EKAFRVREPKVFRRHLKTTQIALENRGRGSYIAETRAKSREKFVDCTSCPVPRGLCLSKGVLMLGLMGGLRVAVRGSLGLAFLSLLLLPLNVFAQTPPPPINLSNGVGGGFNPVMALDAKGGIDVAWIGSGVFFARSVDGGATFSTTTVTSLGSPP